MGIKIGNPFKNSGSLTKTIGSFIPGIGDASAAADANQINIDQAEINRRFQAEMSNTAYQRGMADMKKAGLNPILAYMQGPASQPTGATASVSPESRTRLADMALSAYTGVKGAATAKQTADQQATQIDSSVQLNSANAAKMLQEAENIRLKNKKLRKGEPLDDMAHDLTKNVKKIYDNFNKSAKDIKDAPKSIKLNIKKNLKTIEILKTKFRNTYATRRQKWKHLNFKTESFLLSV